MKKLTFKKFLSLFTVLVLCLGCLCFAGCKTEEETKTPTVDVIDISNLTSNGITLVKKNAVIVGDHLEETLTATITGANSQTKLVWDIAWNNPSHPEDISECLSLTPSNDGRSCVVACYRSFGFNEFVFAIITVSVKDNPEIYATCRVEYLGYPDTLVINNTFSEMNETGTKSISCTLERNLFDMSNEFIMALFKVDVEMSGSVTALCTYYDENGNAVESKEVTRNTNSPKKFDLTLGGKTQQVDFVRFLTSANFIKYEKEFYIVDELNLSSNAVNGRFRLIPEDFVTDTINGVLVDYDLTFTVTLTEVISGVSNSFSFKLNSKSLEQNVSSVILDKETITF